MANVIQIKRGAESARSGFTPAAGEPIFVTDENKLYIGDGSTAVQSLSALGGDLTMANGSNNRVMTATSSSAMNSEANLTFDGSTLAVTGDATVSDDLGLVSDSAKLTFGANSEVVVEHVHNVGLTLKHTATADDKPIALTLQTGETDIAANDVIGKVDFQAPDEGTGTDAILVAAGIEAVSEGDFSSSNNATKLSFKTAASEAAAEKMSLSSGGNLTVSGNVIAVDLDISGNVDVDGTLETDALSIGSTTVTSTAAELNILDGVTSTAAELNALDGITAVVGELNALDIGSTAVGTAVASKAVILDSNKDYTGLRNVTLSGELDAGSLDISGNADIDGTLETDALSIGSTTVTATAAELNILDGVTSTAAELNALDGITAVVGELNALDIGSTAVGTAVASKAVILDSNKDYTGMRNLTVSGELDAATGDFSGDVDVDGTLTTDALVVQGNTTVQNILAGAVSNTIQFEGSDNDTEETTLGVIDPTADRTINLPNQSGTIPVLAAVSATQISSTPEELNILDGATVVVGEINALDLGSTAVGTAIASKAVILDSNKDYTGLRNVTLSGELDAGSLDISGNADIDGTLETDALSIGSTTVTATAAELNILDGVTSTAAELNILDGVTSTAAELNILDGVTSTAAELNALDGITAVVGELNALDIGSTAVGTAVASKAVILDSNKDYTGLRNVTLSGELDAGSLDISGNADIDGTLETDALSIGSTTVTATAAELNILDGVTSTAAELNILDGVTSTAAELNILDGVTSTAAELNALDGITAVVGELNLLDMGSTANGTAVASKALVLNSDKDTSGIRNLTISGALDGATVDGGTYS